MKIKFGEIADIQMGQSPSSSTYNAIGEGLPFYQGITEFGDKYPVKRMYTTKPTKIAQKGDILFSVRAPVGEVNIATERCCIGRGNASIRMNNGNQEYLYYLLKANKKNIRNYTSGTVFDSISGIELRNIEIDVEPNSEEQKRIANILSSFDNKIEILKKENKILEDIAENIFKEWFVKYNFPNKDGKPYRDSNGKMIDSELGPIPDGWRVGKLGDYFPVITGKRNANHAVENGKYMFFTCSQDTLLCNEYSFDNGALLLAGNGDFNIKWYKGKFDAYQRTYVLIPYKQENLAYLFFLMKHYLNDIIVGNRGSVISFITKGMIENFTVSILNEDTEKQANKIFTNITQQQAQNDIEIEILSKIKNTLIKDLIK